MLPKLACLQRIVMRRVAADYGWEYPYVPPALLSEMERERWYHDEIWSHLKVPRIKSTDLNLTDLNPRFERCLRDWSPGRYIFADRVVLKCPGKVYQVFSITTTDSNGDTLVLPDPRFYH